MSGLDVVHGNLCAPTCACGGARVGPYLLGRVYVREAMKALQELPDGSVDLVMTDPTYSSGGLMRSDRVVAVAGKYCQDDDARGRISFSGDNRDGRSWCYWMALWLSEAMRVLREGGYVGIFADWRQAPYGTDSIQAGGLVWRGTAVWDKGESARAPHKGYFRHQAEYVIWGTKGPLKPATHGGPWPGVYRFPVLQGDKHHITGKPTELMRALVQCVPPGSVVLDPFAGSGTTVLAAELEGRRGVGFELVPENVAIAMSRLEGAREGISGRAAIEGQRGLFASPGAPVTDGATRADEHVCFATGHGTACSICHCEIG